MVFCFNLALLGVRTRPNCFHSGSQFGSRIFIGDPALICVRVPLELVQSISSGFHSGLLLGCTKRHRLPLSSFLDFVPAWLH